MTTTPHSNAIEPTVFVIDDDDSVLESIAETVRTMDLRAECYSSAAAFLSAFANTRRGCVITDVTMPGMTGLQLQQELKARGATIPLIVITGHGDVPMAVAALRNGAMNFLEKPYAPHELRESIREAIRIDTQGSQASTRRLHIFGQLEQLTDEERKVVEGIASGKTAKVIAQELELSLRTIQFRRASAMRKLNVGRAELVELLLEARQAAAESSIRWK